MIVPVDGVGQIYVAHTEPVGSPPIMFIHGVGLDLTWWGAQFQRFGDTRELIALDLPGHGQSSALGTPPTFDILSSAVERVIEELAQQPVHLVGLSVGGMIAQHVALRRPDLVRSLCLVATWCVFPDTIRGVLRERADVARREGMATIAELSTRRWFTEDFLKNRPDVVARATRSLLGQSPDFHAGMWDMIAGLDVESRITAISCPTLVVVGGADPNAPETAGRAIADRIGGSRLVVMPGLGHFPPLEADVAFNDLLEQFVRTVEQQDGDEAANAPKPYTA